MNSSLAGKRILVTGHTGFSGSWLTNLLEELDAFVLGISIDRDESRLTYMDSIFTRTQEVFQDIRDLSQLKKTISGFNPEICFHLAAQPLISTAKSDPIFTIETNILGTANILEIFRESNSLKVLIISTTDKVYKPGLLGNYKENSPLWGTEIYSSSKVGTEAIIDGYCFTYNSQFKSEGKQIAAIRAGNLIGGGDWSYNRLVPDIFKSVIFDKPLKIRNPTYTRPWQHVFDAVYVYVLVAEKLLQNFQYVKHVWNVSTQKKSHKVIDVVEGFSRYLSLAGKNLNYVIDNFIDLKESSKLSLSSKKYDREFGMYKTLDLQDTIKFTSDWYLNFWSSSVNKQLEFTRRQVYQLMLRKKQ